MWEQTANPEGYDGISFRRDNFIVASKKNSEPASLTWHVLLCEPDGSTKVLPGSGVWCQTRVGAPFTKDDFQQAANWADDQIGRPARAE